MKHLGNYLTFRVILCTFLQMRPQVDIVTACPVQGDIMSHYVLLKELYTFSWLLRMKCSYGFCSQVFKVFVFKRARSAVIEIRLVYIWLISGSSTGLQEAEEKEGLSHRHWGISCAEGKTVLKGGVWLEDKTKHTLQLSCILHTMTTRGHVRDPAIKLHVDYSVR